MSSRYFINENDQIRQIANPEEDFKYRINRNERFNIKQREAMNGMQRTRDTTAIRVD